MGKPGASLFLLYTGCVNQWINQLLFISHNTEDILYYRLVFEVDQMEEKIMVVINGGLNKRLFVPNNRLFSWDVCKSIKYAINLNQPIF